MTTRRLMVSEVFQLANGQVVVAGRLEGDPQLVGPGSWRLEVAGRELVVLKASGEIVPNQRSPGSSGEGHRAIGFEGSPEAEELRQARGRGVLVEL